MGERVQGRAKAALPPRVSSLGGRRQLAWMGTFVHAPSLIRRQLRRARAATPRWAAAGPSLLSLSLSVPRREEAFAHCCFSLSFFPSFGAEYVAPPTDSLSATGRTAGGRDERRLKCKE